MHYSRCHKRLSLHWPPCASQSARPSSRRDPRASCTSYSPAAAVSYAASPSGFVRSATGHHPAPPLPPHLNHSLPVARAALPSLDPGCGPNHGTPESHASSAPDPHHPPFPVAPYNIRSVELSSRLTATSFPYRSWVGMQQQQPSYTCYSNRDTPHTRTRTRTPMHRRN